MTKSAHKSRGRTQLRFHPQHTLCCVVSGSRRYASMKLGIRTRTGVLSGLALLLGVITPIRAYAPGFACPSRCIDLFGRLKEGTQKVDVQLRGGTRQSNDILSLDSTLSTFPPHTPEMVLSSPHRVLLLRKQRYFLGLKASGRRLCFARNK